MSGDCQFPEQCGFPDCFCTGMIFDDLEPFGEDVGEEILDDDIKFLAGGDTIDELTRNFKEVMDEYGEA